MSKIQMAVLSLVVLVCMLTSCTSSVVITLPGSDVPTTENKTSLPTLPMTTADHVVTVTPSESGEPTIGDENTSTATPEMPYTPTLTPTPTPTPTPIEYRDYDFSKVSLRSKNTAIYDMYEDRFVYMKNVDENDRVYPASITKLYMIHVGKQYLSLDEEITAGDEIKLVNPFSSFANIKKGDRLTVEMIIEGMLLPSGNDAAHVLAAAAGKKILGDESASAKDAIKAFIDRVNEHAAKDGLSGTHFVTPDGLHDDDHYTTIHDLFEIAKMSMLDPLVSKYMRIFRDDVTYASGHSETWTNRNVMLNPASKYYCPEIVGLKTGHTVQAGYCLLSAAEIDGRTIIMLVMGSDGSNYRFEDTLKLVGELKKY